MDPARADGIGPQQYRYVYPPRFLQLTNQQPDSVRQTVSLHATAPVIVGTQDNQATVYFPPGTFGFPSGQTGISVHIRPLRHYHAPRRAGLALDGNVYQITYRYVPSRATPAHVNHQILISLGAPHYPLSDMMGLVRGRWRVLCTASVLLPTLYAVNCDTKALASQVTLLYRRPGRHHRHKGKSNIWPVPIIIAVVIVAIWAVLILFLITRRRGPVGGRRKDEG